MNGLPDARRAIHGRTHSQSWNGGEMNPIERHRGASVTERVLDVLLAVFLGIVGALGLVHWLAA